MTDATHSRLQKVRTSRYQHDARAQQTAQQIRNLADQVLAELRARRPAAAAARRIADDALKLLTSVTAIGALDEVGAMLRAPADLVPAGDDQVAS